MSASGQLVDYGETWWGGRWVDALEEAGESWAERLPRGDEDVRRGRVGALDVDTGRIAATVRGESSRGHEVEILVEPFDDATWNAIVERLAGELRFTARLVAGELPRDVEHLVEDIGTSLFPEADELQASCPCDDDVVPCRHVAAVHFAFAGELDRDPLLLLRVRGRDRGSLLAALRAQRSGSTATQRHEREADLEPIGPDGFYDADELDAIALHPAKTDEPGALLDRLGPPPGVKDTEPLVALIERAVETGWRVAAGEGAAVADDETLLAELRARGVATAREVADGLGWPPDRTKDALDRLWEAGDVMRTGSGDAARYRAG